MQLLQNKTNDDLQEKKAIMRALLCTLRLAKRDNMPGPIQR